MNNEQVNDQANDHFLADDETPASSERRTNLSQRQQSWQRQAWNALITPTFTPRFPRGPLHRPLIGYLAAILLQVLAGIVVMLLAQASPTLHFPGGLVLLIIPLTALIWGTGPSILATFGGAALFIYLRLSHYFSYSNIRPEDIISIFLYLIIGLTISLLASQTQNTRYRAALETNRLHRYYEELVIQLLAEREARQASEHKIHLREQQIEAIFAFTTDALFILDALGAPLQVNEAARSLLDLAPNSKMTATSFEQLFDLFDEAGKPLPPEVWPGTRLLKGERLYEDRASVVLIRTHTGQFRSVTITGMPVRDENNMVVGAVLVCHQ